MKVKFWGTRGSIAVPGKNTTLYGGNTTCVELTLGCGRTVIIDAGTGIRALGEKLTAAGEEVDVHLLVTHIHWDHILGFPFFSPIYKRANRLAIDGFPTCMKGLRYTFDNKMGDGFFPITFDALKAQVTFLNRLDKGSLEIDGTTIDSVPLHHPQGGFGYRFKEDGKVLVFITDNELRKDSWEGRSPDDYVRFCQGADILIHDSQYSPQEIPERRDWGHSDYESAFNLAYRAGVKRLILFHHDPSRTDPEVTAIKVLCEDLAKKKHSGIKIEAARENSELEL
ncbi:MAG: MBL fold metallo-hydrolase [Desulfobacteraceae bacterium]|nr:MAG: MBL fold metallo-hydrolase [Desulfobacteraceae bacterium]